jgi:hypothetical protein
VRWEWLERVKGIEPSYSAWKAAALPLSYTRAPGRSPNTPGVRSQPPTEGWIALNSPNSPAYIDVSVNNERR